jgi:plasmid stability protein
MPDLLIRNIDPDLKRRLEESAQSHRRSLSDEAKMLIRRGLVEPVQDNAEPGEKKKGLGTRMMELLPPEYRSDDYVFEFPEPVRKPPDFK